jgi:hypothetical protein
MTRIVFINQISRILPLLPLLFALLEEEFAGRWGLPNFFFCDMKSNKTLMPTQKFTTPLSIEIVSVIIVFLYQQAQHQQIIFLCSFRPCSDKLINQFLCLRDQ